MPVLDPVQVLSVPIISSTTAGQAGLMAYGPAPGMELIPYFLALLAWIGMAIMAICVSPITALYRRLRHGKQAVRAKPVSEPVNTPVRESSGDGNNVPT